MLSRFQQYIDKEKLFTYQDHILIAVSGGVDSMVLLQLMMESNYQIGVAHINHQMREEESDEDAHFIKQFCFNNNIPFFETSLPPSFKETGNFQDSARNYRYQWLSDISLENNFSKIATAHHKDDHIESFLLHLFRGAGLSGLKGITHHDQIVRPLLCFSKKELIEYANLKKVNFREDSSNNTDKYTRNKIRQVLIPAIDSTFSNGPKGLEKSIQHLTKTENLLSEFLKTIPTTISKNQEKILAKKDIHCFQNGTQLLYLLVKPNGFHYNQIIDITNNAQVGAKIYSSDYELINERNEYIIRPLITKEIVEELLIEQDGIYFFAKNQLEIKYNHGHLKIFNNEKGLNLILNGAPYPILLRKKKDGDKFRPTGMNGRGKSVKKFITELKLNSLEKEKVIIIEKNHEIIAVFPYRKGEGF